MPRSAPRRLLPLPLLLLALAAACAHVSEKDREASRAYYELALQLQTNGDTVGALRELERALNTDPQNAPAHNVSGVLMHLSFNRLEEAEGHFKKALQIDPKFSEAHTNLGNLHLSQGRYDAAITAYRKALENVLYETPYIAQANLGWALYKQGDVERGVAEIRAAVQANPQFCLGFRNLGTIHDEQAQRLEREGQGEAARRALEESLRNLTRYREACPQVADAFLRSGLVEAKLGQAERARESFGKCAELATGSADLRERCQGLAEKLR
jgi:Tfp pilus assembly protein PilF